MSTVPQHTGRGPMVAAAGVAAAVVAVFLQLARTPGYDAVGGMVTSVVAAAALILLAVRLSRRQADDVVRRLVLWSAVLKVGATVVRFLVAYVVYGGAADASRYYVVGGDVAERLRVLDLGGALDLAGIVGTSFMDLLAGVVFTFVGPSRLGGFVVFAALSWVGQYCFLRAAQVVWPHLRLRVYAAGVLLLPSLVYWPASLGKEAVMIFALGAATYGLAVRFSDVARGGRLALVGGVTVMTLLRPHVGMLFLVAVAVALVLVRGRSRRITGWQRWALVTVIMVGGLVAVQQSAAFLGTEELTLGQLEQTLDTVSTNTSTGGSEFDNVRVTNPLLLPLGIVSVLFRPFPWEAPNLQALVLSLESLALLGWLVWQRDRVLGALRRVRTNELALTALVFTVLFVVAFSTFNNFGLLARERVQAFPFLLLALTAGTAVLPGHDRDETPKQDAASDDAGRAIRGVPA